MAIRIRLPQTGEFLVRATDGVAPVLRKCALPKSHSTTVTSFGIINNLCTEGFQQTNQHMGKFTPSDRFAWEDLAVMTADVVDCLDAFEAVLGLACQVMAVGIKNRSTKTSQGPQFRSGSLQSLQRISDPFPIRRTPSLPVSAEGLRRSERLATNLVAM